jgi:hypothetical protein
MPIHLDAGKYGELPARGRAIARLQPGLQRIEEGLYGPLMGSAIHNVHRAIQKFGHQAAGQR